MAPPQIAHKTTEAYVVSICEHYCKSPVNLAAYTLTVSLSFSEAVCHKVRALGTSVLNLQSFMPNVSGNEAGVGGGVPFSGINCGVCKPISDYARTVKAGGFCILRHDTVMEMNCVNNDSPGDIFGRIAYCQNPKKAAKSASTSAAAPTVPAKSLPDKVLIETGNGNTLEVEIYRTADSSIGGGFYEPGKITLGPNADEYSLENEMQTARDDARDGTLDGVLHDENGKELSVLEGEIRSDAASYELAKKHTYESRNSFGCSVRYSAMAKTLIKDAREFYKARMEAMKKADQLIKEGKFEEAQQMANANEGKAGDYIQRALDMECGQ